MFIILQKLQLDEADRIVFLFLLWQPSKYVLLHRSRQTTTGRRTVATSIRILCRFAGAVSTFSANHRPFKNEQGSETFGKHFRNFKNEQSSDTDPLKKESLKRAAIDN